MANEIFSGSHEYVATTLAREMNEYFEHHKRMMSYFDKLDERGNRPVYRIQDLTQTEERQLKVVVFCAIYVEALANLYLSLKLTEEQFAAVDRIEVVEKWTSIPALFLPGYSIPRSEALFGNLKALIVHRNAVAHMKPRITIGDKVIHKGNPQRKTKINAQIERWDRLPAELIENLGAYDHSLAFTKFKALSCIDAYEKIRKQATRRSPKPAVGRDGSKSRRF